MNKQPVIVLYVEDEEGDRFFMERAFASEGPGIVLKTVNNGRAAIKYLSGLDGFADRVQYPVPDFILLDLNLPQVSGFEVLQWIRNHPSYATLPVVIFSASAHEEDRVRAKALGAQDYVQKPSSGRQYSKIVAMLREKWFQPSAQYSPEASQQPRC